MVVKAPWRRDFETEKDIKKYIVFYMWYIVLHMWTTEKELSMNLPAENTV